MTDVSSPLISDIRAASRDLVREFGLMNQGVAGTDLSLSAVHAIIEIGLASELSARDLSNQLLLEKSTVSRLVKSLAERGEIREARVPHDGRMKHLHLTSRGKKTLTKINRFAETQVSGALACLDQRAQFGVLKGLRDYSTALKIAAGSEPTRDKITGFTIATGYAPTLLGRMVTMLHGYMNRHFGFGRAFETRISTDCAEFLSRIESPRNQIWRAELGDEIVGTLSIDGEDLGDNLAHLRWFAVDDSIQGGGVGNALLTAALEFCDQSGFRETQLWTVKGLDAARRLYERRGFELVEEYRGDQWGSTVIEHKFVRPLNGHQNSSR